MIEAMPDPDEIAILKRRVSALEDVVTNLILANMKLINVHNALIAANGLKTKYISNDMPEDVQRNYFAIFDSISEDFEKIGNE